MLKLLFLLASPLFPPCHYEDDLACRWDARSSGVSFVSVGTETLGEVLLYEDGELAYYPPID